MAQGSDAYHEPYELLSSTTREMHRAIVSLIEELEAVDWYQQRADAAGDAALEEILLHNKREEMEHAAMTLEWIRRHDADFDARLREYLFTEGSIVAREEAQENGAGDASGSLGIGRIDRGGA